jgi:hypothetical protein
MIEHGIVPAIEGEKQRRHGLQRIEHAKPTVFDHVFFHRPKEVTLKEMRSMPRGGGAVEEVNRLRRLHTGAHYDLDIIESEVVRAQKDLKRLKNTKQRIPDKEARIARCEAIISGAAERRKAAKEKIKQTNGDLPIAERSLHLGL